MRKLIQIGLELWQILIPDLASLNVEVFLQQGAVEAFEVAVNLWLANLRGAVFDAFELEEKLVRMLVAPAAGLASVVGKALTLIDETIIDSNPQRQLGDEITS